MRSLTTATFPTASGLANPDPSSKRPARLSFGGNRNIFLVLCCVFPKLGKWSSVFSFRKERLQLGSQHGRLGVHGGQEYLEDEGSSRCQKGQRQGESLGMSSALGCQGGDSQREEVANANMRPNHALLSLSVSFFHLGSSRSGEAYHQALRHKQPDPPFFLPKHSGLAE